MSNCVSFQAQLAYILDVLAKSALAEITKLVDDGSAALRLEMSRSQRENEALKTKLLLMEGELRAVRGYGEETPENSLNISFEVQVCDEFGEAQRQNGNRLTPEKVSMGRLESCGSVSMKTEDARLQLTHIKREPEDEELDWSESLLLSGDRLEEDPEGSQSQAEQKISEENTCGMLRAADCAEGPLCEEEEEEEEELRVELKQDPEGWPLTPPPNLMQVHCVWSEAGGLGTLPEKHGPRGGKEKQRDVQGNLGCCEEFQRATPGKKFFGRNDSWDPGDDACEVHSEASGRSGGDGLPFPTPSPETDRLARAEDKPPGRRRRYNKKQYCLYCQKGYSKISRHLEHVHHREPDVACAMRFPKHSKERHVRLTQLRNQGNFVHNSTVARTGAGELVVRRRFGPKRELSDFRYCPYCKGLFAKLLLWRHVKGCQLRTEAGGDEASRFGRLRARSFWELSGPCPPDISEDLKRLICGMADDEVLAAMKEERCILQLGENMLSRLGGDGGSHEYIRQRLRTVARLLVEVRKRTPLATLEDLLVPSNFPHIVAAVRGVAGFSEERNCYRTPSLARRVSYGLHGICCLVEEEASAKGDSRLAQSTRDFRNILQRRWGELVPSGTPAPLEGDESDRPLQVTLTQDVTLLSSYLDERLERLQHQVLLDPTRRSYGALARVALAQVVLFNRARPGPVSEMPVAAFTSRRASPAEPLGEEDDSISPLERKLRRHFAGVELRGKGGEKVLVLLKPSAEAAMDLLVRNREACGVPRDNPRVFARPGALSCYPSGTCVRQLAEECGAERPAAISSARLRKHVAAILNVVSLKESGALVDAFGRDFEAAGKLGLLAEAAGDDDLQLAELVKELLAMDKEPSSEKNAEESADYAPVHEKPAHIGPPKRRCPKPGVTRRKWESREVEAVERHLMSFIRTRRLPPKRDCLRCVLAEPSALRNRSWSSVKFYIKNTIAASKKQRYKR